MEEKEKIELFEAAYQALARLGEAAHDPQVSLKEFMEIEKEWKRCFDMINSEDLRGEYEAWRDAKEGKAATV